MRRAALVVVLTVAASTFGLSTDDAFGQRGQRGQRGGGGAAAALDEAAILENFDEIVELIWTDDEDDAWGDADSDEQKQAFITAFWERRDPTPGTVDNEFRDIWMQRASYAARAFGREGGAGYGTDRGKFYLIYGPAAITSQETKQVSGSSQGSVNGATAGAGQGGSIIIWELDQAHNPFLDGKKDVSFAQYQRSFSKLTGGIEYSQEAFLASQDVKAYFEARRANPSAAGPTGGAAAGGGGAPAPAAAAAAPTPDRVAIQELLRSGTSRQDLTLKQSSGFIPAQAGNTFTIFNFEVGKEGLTFEQDGAPGAARMKVFGALMQKDATQPGGESLMHDITIDFSVDPSEGNAEEIGTHSFGLTLVPGAYRLAWGVMDMASERMATTSYEFEVPSFSAGELQIPSVIMANGMEQKTDDIAVNTIYRGTRVGNLELATDIDNIFRRNDTMLLLYFIQGAALDPATQQTKLEVDHQIFVAGTDEGVGRLPGQTLPFYAVQQEIPLAQIPQLEAGGQYEIEVHVTDQITGNELTQRLPFSITAGQ